MTDIWYPVEPPWWNTPTAINQHGDVVGFAGDPAFVEGDVTTRFHVDQEDGIRPLKPLKGRTPQHVDSEAYGINERRQVVGAPATRTPGLIVAPLFGTTVPTPTDLNDLKGGYSAFLALKCKTGNRQGRGLQVELSSTQSAGALIAYLAAPVGGH